MRNSSHAYGPQNHRRRVDGRVSVEGLLRLAAFHVGRATMQFDEEPGHRGCQSRLANARFKRRSGTSMTPFHPSVQLLQGHPLSRAARVWHGIGRAQDTGRLGTGPLGPIRFLYLTTSRCWLQDAGKCPSGSPTAGLHGYECWCRKAVLRCRSEGRQRVAQRLVDGRKMEAAGSL